MRTKTVTKYFLTFEELNDDQKEEVLNKHRDWNVDGLDWWDFIYDDAKKIGELMGINISKIYFSGFWSQGDGACFEGCFSYTKDMVKKVKEYAPKDEVLHRIARDMQELYRKSFYTAWGSIVHRGHYYHERSMDVDVDCEKGVVNWDDWEDVFADLASWIYGQLEKEYEYLTSDEMVADSLIANEIEFEIDEEGELI